MVNNPFQYSSFFWFQLLKFALQDISYSIINQSDPLDEIIAVE